MHEAAPPTFQGLRRRWRIAEQPNPQLAEALGTLPRLMAGLLYQRGLRTHDEVQEFLSVSDSLLEDPSLLPDIDRAVERLQQSRDRNELVAVYGDFDADGVTGTALMVRALSRFGIRVVPYIPHRVTEGHGLNTRAIEGLREQGVQLIVTVDCGVTDVQPVALASELGMDIIVTDHHTADIDLPQAAAIINPKVPGSAYLFDQLTGVGMALKLAQVLLEPVFGESWNQGLMELAAIGTITDMAPLTGENRYLVHHGLVELRHTTTLGLRTMMHSAGVEPSLLDAEGIGFTIGPRLNAAGRLDHAMKAYELLMTEAPDTADALVAEMEHYNSERRQLTNRVLEASRAQLTKAGGSDSLTFVGDASYHPGVVGLVAGKLVEELGAPAVVYALDGETARASCRSGPDFHWARALSACDALLEHYGGHAQAAGFTCSVGNLAELEGRLQAIATEQQSNGSPIGDRLIEAEVSLKELMGPNFQILRQMEPFGIGNPAPVFLTRGLLVDDVRTMGANGQHLRLRLRSDGTAWNAVAFQQAWTRGIERVDIVYTLDVDQWRGVPRLRLTIQDYQGTALGPPLG
jgi:single-stranded-DNA-specific exonuclease